MASKPSVTLTFAGDSTKLEQAMSRVGSGSERLSQQVGESSNRMRDGGSAAERMAEGTDTAESRSQGFADVITGATEGLSAWNDESLSTSEKMIAMGQAGADLAGGLTNFLIPAVAALATGLKTGLGSALSFIAAHPIVFALLALAALFVLLWTRSETFREIVTKAFNTVAGWVTKALDWIIEKGGAFLSWYLGMPGRILGVFATIGDGIKNAFRAAFNFVSDAWNNTVGRLSWTVPGWVPGLGGSSVSAPRLPRFHTGGVVPGQPGTDVLAILQAGERVTTSVGGGGLRVVFAGHTDGAFATAFMELVRIGAISLEPA